MDDKPDLSPLFFLTLRDGPWEIRVHGPHTSPGWKHVHIARNGLNGEYSWNINGTRHDKHKFPTSRKSIEKSKAIAAEHLNVPVNTLQFLTSATISPRHVVIEILWKKNLRVLMAGGKGASLSVLSSQDGNVHFMIVDKRRSRRSEAIIGQ